MAGDDVKFIAILLGSVVVSALLRVCPTRFRADAAAMVGIVAIIGACGPSNALHPLVALVLSIAALHISPVRWRPLASFALAFGHLAFVRLLPSPPGGPTNAAMLLLTLRLSAAEAQSTGELIRYVCCFHGLFTGPYVSHAEWHAAMRTPQPVPTARALVGAVLAAVGALLVWRGVAFALPYRLVADSGASVGASTAAAADDALWIVRTLPSLRDPAYIWLRLCYFYASSYQFRWRFYACWLVMDVSGQLLGLAVQPAQRTRPAARPA